MEGGTTDGTARLDLVRARSRPLDPRYCRIYGLNQAGNFCKTVPLGTNTVGQRALPRWHRVTQSPDS